MSTYKRFRELLKTAVLFVSLMIPICSIGLLSVIGLPGMAVAENNVQYIKNNDYGDEVIKLHQKLRELGYFGMRAESPWSWKSSDALMILQENLDLPVTGIVESKEQLDEILRIDSANVVGKNLVKNGDFVDDKQYWAPWGSPPVCEIVTIDNKHWMHLVSSGTKYEGLAQSVRERDGDAGTAELKAGRQYTVSFTAYGERESVGKKFIIGFHNNSLSDGAIQEQYWTQPFELTADPVRYTYTFKCNVDGTFNIMVGTGLSDVIEAWYSEIKFEVGNRATGWMTAE